ncbi:MAG: hypothetical protein WA384_06620, partial [Rhodomicrobium sp.]
GRISPVERALGDDNRHPLLVGRTIAFCLVLFLPLPVAVSELTHSNISIGNAHVNNRKKFLAKGRHECGGAPKAPPGELRFS